MRKHVHQKGILPLLNVILRSGFKIPSCSAPVIGFRMCNLYFAFLRHVYAFIPRRDRCSGADKWIGLLLIGHCSI